MGGISIWQLLIILGIVLLLFGTKKLRHVGGDLGFAIKNFKKAMSEEDKDKAEATTQTREGAGGDPADATTAQGDQAGDHAGVSGDRPENRKAG